MKEVAFIIDNLVQFYSIRQGVDELTQRGVGVDLYVPDDPSMEEQAKYAYDAIKNAGYNPLSRASREHYKVILEPYPKLESKKSLSGITYSYRLKYKYSLMTAKPNPVYHPNWNIPYDAILTPSRYEYEILKSYTKTHLVIPYRKNYKVNKYHRSKSKKRILYLPTFNDVDPINYPSIEQSFNTLSKEYEIIIKKHHATQFRPSEKMHNDFLNTLAKQIYDQSTPLGEIINKADVVLTGNSGSIFEALYYKKPVAVFADDINKHKLGVDTFQYQLMQQGILPYTNIASEIPDVVNLAFAKLKNQLKVSEEQFGNKGVEREKFSDVVVRYIGRDNNNDNAYKLHRELIDYVNSLRQDRRELSKNAAKLKSDIINLELLVKKYKHEITGYEKSLSWKITRPLRELKSKANNMIKYGRR